MFPGKITRVAWLLTSFLFGGAAWRSVSAARGDALYRQNTLESLRRAVTVEPANAAYHALLAEHIEGMGVNPDAEFIRAARLSPLDSRWWIRLGFRSEVEGDFARSEQYLTRAVSVDRKFEPRWAFMNYYFRQGKADSFWYWASQSLAMSYGDVTTPVFRLMWDMTQDGTAIERHIPQRRDVMMKYLSFLTASHVDSASSIARSAAMLAQDAGDAAAVEDYCDRIAGRDAQAALAPWNALCNRKLIPFAAIDPRAHASTNDKFDIPISQRGFDWRTSAVDGVSYSAEGPGAGLEIHLDGSEAEDCTLLSQILPVMPGVRYVLSYDYRSEGDHGFEGLMWKIHNSRDSADSSIGIPLAPQNEWRTSRFPFTLNGSAQSLPSAGSRGSVTLSLQYKRPLGSTTADASLYLKRVSVEAAPSTQ